MPDPKDKKRTPNLSGITAGGAIFELIRGLFSDDDKYPRFEGVADSPEELQRRRGIREEATRERGVRREFREEGLTGPANEMFSEVFSALQDNPGVAQGVRTGLTAASLPARPAAAAVGGAVNAVGDVSKAAFEALPQGGQDALAAGAERAVRAPLRSASGALAGMVDTENPSFFDKMQADLSERAAVMGGMPEEDFQGQFGPGGAPEISAAHRFATEFIDPMNYVGNNLFKRALIAGAQNVYSPWGYEDAETPAGERFVAGLAAAPAMEKALGKAGQLGKSVLQNPTIQRGLNRLPEGTLGNAAAAGAGAAIAGGATGEEDSAGLSALIGASMGAGSRSALSKLLSSGATQGAPGRELQNILGHDYAILTADAPMHPVSAAIGEGMNPNDALRSRLMELGVREEDIIPVVGRYGGPDENSFIVRGINRDQAIELGREFGQNEVIVPEGMVDVNSGATAPATGKALLGDAAVESGFYSELPEGLNVRGPRHFALDFDFDNRVGLDQLSPKGLHEITLNEGNRKLLSTVAKEHFGLEDVDGLTDQDLLRYASTASLLASRAEGPQVRLRRFTPVEGQRVLDPEKNDALTGVADASARRRANDPENFQRRLYYYIGDAKPEDLVSRSEANYEYETSIPESLLYNLAEDAEGVIQRAGGDVTQVEKLLKEEGYVGYFNPLSQNKDIAAVFAPLPAKPVASKQAPTEKLTGIATVVDADGNVYRGANHGEALNEFYKTKGIVEDPERGLTQAEWAAVDKATKEARLEHGFEVVNLSTGKRRAVGRDEAQRITKSKKSPHANSLERSHVATKEELAAADKLRVTQERRGIDRWIQDWPKGGSALINPLSPVNVRRVREAPADQLERLLQAAVSRSKLKNLPDGEAPERALVNLEALLWKSLPQHERSRMLQMIPRDFADELDVQSLISNVGRLIDHVRMRQESSGGFDKLLTPALIAASASAAAMADGENEGMATAGIVGGIFGLPAAMAKGRRPHFRSRFFDVLETLPQEKVTVKDLRNFMEGKTSKEEVDYVLRSWGDKDKLTKSELLDIREAMEIKLSEDIYQGSDSYHIVSGKLQHANEVAVDFINFFSPIPNRNPEGITGHRILQDIRDGEMSPSEAAHKIWMGDKGQQSLMVYHAEDDPTGRLAKEAMLQMQELLAKYLRIHGEIEEYLGPRGAAAGRAGYEQFISQGPSANYREIVITQTSPPVTPSQMGSYIGHYRNSGGMVGGYPWTEGQGKNLQVAVRTTDRASVLDQGSGYESPKFNDILYVEEIQADLHQTASKQYFEHMKNFEEGRTTVAPEKSWGYAAPVDQELLRKLDAEHYAVAQRLKDSLDDFSAELAPVLERLVQDGHIYAIEERSHPRGWFINVDGTEGTGVTLRLADMANYDKAYNFVYNLEQQLGGRNDSITGKIQDLIANYQTRTHELRHLQTRLELDKSNALARPHAMPDVPFKDQKAWTGLAIRRIIADAIDRGKSTIAFTNGEDQAIRWPNTDMQNYLVDEGYLDSLWGSNYSRILQASQEAAARRDPEYMGMIHGHSLYRYYNKIVTSVIKKEVKKLDPDAVVELAAHESITAPDGSGKPHPVPTIRVSEKMREKVINEGLELAGIAALIGTTAAMGGEDSEAALAAAGIFARGKGDGVHFNTRVHRAVERFPMPHGLLEDVGTYLRKNVPAEELRSFKIPQLLELTKARGSRKIAKKTLKDWIDAHNVDIVESYGIKDRQRDLSYKVRNTADDIGRVFYRGAAEDELIIRDITFTPGYAYQAVSSALYDSRFVNPVGAEGSAAISMQALDNTARTAWGQLNAISQEIKEILLANGPDGLNIDEYVAKMATARSQVQGATRELLSIFPSRDHFEAAAGNHADEQVLGAYDALGDWVNRNDAFGESFQKELATKLDELRGIHNAWRAEGLKRQELEAQTGGRVFEARYANNSWRESGDVEDYAEVVVELASPVLAGKDYTNGHYSPELTGGVVEKTVLGHLRYTGRKINWPGVEEKALFVEEYQADVQQRGRKDGFARELTAEDQLEIQRLKSQGESIQERLNQIVLHGIPEKNLKSVRFYEDIYADLSDEVNIIHDNMRATLNEMVARELGLDTQALDPGLPLRVHLLSQEGFEEAQSRVIQSAEYAAFRDQKNKELIALDAKIRENDDKLIDLNRIIESLRTQGNDLRNQARKIERATDAKIPDIPFRETKEWAKLLVKRGIAEAVDKGYQWFSWTPGYMQNRRWGQGVKVSGFDVSFERDYLKLSLKNDDPVSAYASGFGMPRKYDIFLNTNELDFDAIKSNILDYMKSSGVTEKKAIEKLSQKIPLIASEIRKVAKMKKADVEIQSAEDPLNYLSSRRQGPMPGKSYTFSTPLVLNEGLAKTYDEAATSAAIREAKKLDPKATLEYVDVGLRDASGNPELVPAIRITERMSQKAKKQGLDMFSVGTGISAALAMESLDENQVLEAKRQHRELRAKIAKELAKPPAQRNGEKLRQWQTELRRFKSNSKRNNERPN